VLPPGVNSLKRLAPVLRPCALSKCSSVPAAVLVIVLAVR